VEQRYQQTENKPGKLKDHLQQVTCSGLLAQYGKSRRFGSGLKVCCYPFFGNMPANPKAPPANAVAATKRRMIAGISGAANGQRAVGRPDHSQS
jgi:hypothetical protein